jgi:surface polysaccharide O-acyltransferase-like enzyme
LVCIASVFFRASGVRQGAGIVKALIDPRRFSLSEIHAVPLFILIVLAGALIREAYVFAQQKTGYKPPALLNHPVMQSFVVALMFFICLFYRGEGNAFIYFQF